MHRWTTTIITATAITRTGQIFLQFIDTYRSVCSDQLIARSIFVSYGMHAMSYFVSLGIFIRQGRRMQRIQNHCILYIFLTSGVMKYDVKTARVPCFWLEMSLCPTGCTIV